MKTRNTNFEATIIVQSSSEAFCFSIVEDESKADHTKEIVHINCDLAEAALKAIANGYQSFDCNETTYEIIEHEINEQKLNPYYFEKVDLTIHKNHKPIIVFKNKCHCNCESATIFGQKLINVNAIIPLAKGGSAKIDIQKCDYCLKYFIDKSSLKLYEEKYGTIFLERKFDESCKKAGESKFNEDTILSRFAYKAGKDGLPTERRQAIIAKLIDEKIAEKYEIKEILSCFLAQRERCQFAIPHWEEDLEFVNTYNSNKQDIEKGFYFKRP